MGTYHQDRQAKQLPQGEGEMVLTGFQDKQKDHLQTASLASTRPGFRMSCLMSHINLKTASLQEQSYDVNRDVVCQLPPEAHHPPHLAARLKNPAHGMNEAPDAGGTFWTKHSAAMAWFPQEPIDAVMCCIFSSRVCKLGNSGYKEPSHSRTAQKTPSLNHVHAEPK